MANNGGVYQTPTTTTAPVAGVSSGVYTWRQGVNAVVLGNATGQAVYVAFNTDTVTTSPGGYDYYLANGGVEHINAEDAGYGVIEKAAVYVGAGGTVANLRIRGGA